MVTLNVAIVSDDDFERHVLASIRAAREKCAIGDVDGADLLAKRSVKQCREAVQTILDTQIAQEEALSREAIEQPADTAKLKHRRRLLATSLNCNAFVLKAAGKVPKAVRCAREAFDIESEIDGKLTTTALNLCVLYIAVGKYDAAVAMGDEAAAIAGAAEITPPASVMAALHFNRGNAMLHRLTEFGVGKASDAFSALQLAKSFARDAGGNEGDRMFALADKAATSVLEQFGPQVTRELHRRQSHDVIAESAISHGVPAVDIAKPKKKGQIKAAPKGSMFSKNPFKLPAVYRQKAPRPPPPQAAISARRPAPPPAVPVASQLPPIASSGAQSARQPAPPRTPVDSRQPPSTSELGAAMQSHSKRTSSQRVRRAAEARHRAAQELARDPLRTSSLSFHEGTPTNDISRSPTHHQTDNFAEAHQMSQVPESVEQGPPTSSPQSSNHCATADVKGEPTPAAAEEDQSVRHDDSSDQRLPLRSPTPPISPTPERRSSSPTCIGSSHPDDSIPPITPVPPRASAAAVRSPSAHSAQTPELASHHGHHTDDEYGDDDFDLDG